MGSFTEAIKTFYPTASVDMHDDAVVVIVEPAITDRMEDVIFHFAYLFRINKISIRCR